MRGVGLIAAMVLVAGCAGGERVPPRPTSVEATGLSLPPRPRDLRIDGVEPCSLLTERQRAELGLDGRPSSSKTPSVLFGQEEDVCLVSGFSPRAVFVGVGLAANVEIGLIADRAVEADLVLLDVQGFPAILATPRRFSKFCSVFVEVGPSQLLDVQFSDGGRQPPIPQDQLCLDARQVADEVMITLLAR